jgi:hypothetical protein
MRTFIFGTLALLGISGLSKADVVVSNIGTANTSVAFTAGSISFTPTQTISSGSILTLRVFNSNSATASLSALNLQMTVGSGTATYSGTLVGGGAIAANSYGDFTFDLLTQNYTNNTPFSISSISIAAQTTNADAQWAYNTTTPTFSGAWSTGASSPGMFSLDATAVPEPGTLLLGAIAAVSGGGGVWWKRRRKNVEAPAKEELPVA